MLGIVTNLTDFVDLSKILSFRVGAELLIAFSVLRKRGFLIISVIVFQVSIQDRRFIVSVAHKRCISSLKLLRVSILNLRVIVPMAYVKSRQETLVFILCKVARYILVVVMSDITVV